MPVWSPGLHASRHADPNNENRIAIERIKIGIFEGAATALQLQHHDSGWYAPSKRGRELPDRSPSAESNTSACYVSGRHTVMGPGGCSLSSDCLFGATMA